MKVLFISDTIDSWKHGIWYHRIQNPSLALMERGHAIKQVAMGLTFPEAILDWPDTVIFGRTYPTQFNPVKIMREYKARGKRVLYDMDDDYWNVSKDNPSVLTSSAMKDQYEGQIREADALITPSPVLAAKFKKAFKKPVFICPNTVSEDIYQTNPQRNGLTIGYAGAASHWDYLSLVGGVVKKLAEKYDFTFLIFGLTGEPLEAAMYGYKKLLDQNLMPEKNEYFKSALRFGTMLDGLHTVHVPFMPPELYPKTLSSCSIDIGLAPLKDSPFNKGKSCLKYYEYAMTGAAVVASNVPPYNEEVKYLAKNTEKDWYNKIEKLIVDVEFRKKLQKTQKDWVIANRGFAPVGLKWELAAQLPGGLKVLNQQ